MGVKTFKVKFNSIGKQSSIRFDSKFRYFQDIKKAIVWQKNSLKKLKFILQPISCEKVKKGELEQEEYLIDLENIERRHNFLINPQRISNIGSDKTIIRNGDLVLPKLEPKKGQFFLNLQHNRYLGSTELLEFKINQNLFKPLFLYYLLTHETFLNCLGNLESGKTHKRVSGDDLLNIKIPLIPKSTQDQAVAKIKPIEDKIKELKTQIKDPIEIINKVFAKKFRFDLGEFKKRERQNVFLKKFSEFNKNALLRFSTHYQHYKFVIFEKELKNKDYWTNLNSLFAVSGGKRIPKGQSFAKQETEYKYLRPNEVNFWQIKKDEIPSIEFNLYNKLKRYKIDSNDFAISIVGTLGKIALIDLEKLGIEKDSLILSENFVKLKPRKKTNSKFYFYFFNSFIFQNQIDREYTIRTQKKLGLDKFKEIKIPNISPPQQQKIVNEIKTEIDKQEEIRKKVERERKKIDEIINQCIK